MGLSLRVFASCDRSAEVASVVRVVSDTVHKLSVTQAGNYSDSFLRMVDAALSMRPEARPQDIAEFRALLDAGESLQATEGLTDKPGRVEFSSLEATNIVRVVPDMIAQDIQLDRLVMTHVERRWRSGIYFAALACMVVDGSTIWWTLQGSEAHMSYAAPATSVPTKSATTPAPPEAIIAIAIAMAVAGCSTPKPVVSADWVLFEHAAAIDPPFQQSQEAAGFMARRSKQTVVLDPTLDAAIGQQTAATQRLDRTINERVPRNFEQIEVLPFQATGVAKAQYLMVGTLVRPQNTYRVIARPWVNTAARMPRPPASRSACSRAFI